MAMKQLVFREGQVCDRESGGEEIKIETSSLALEFTYVKKWWRQSGSTQAYSVEALCAWSSLSHAAVTK